MERAVEYGPREFLSLVQLTRDHAEALEFDLIKLGLRLRDAGSLDFNWRDLMVICRRLGRDSELYRDMNPEDDTSWSVDTYLLAQLVDNTSFRLYQAAGGKGTKPKPLPRPNSEDHKVVKHDVMPLEEMRDWLGTDWA